MYTSRRLLEEIFLRKMSVFEFLRGQSLDYMFTDLCTGEIILKH